MALANSRHPRSKLILRVVLAVLLTALAACGGKSRRNSVTIEGPSIPPLQRVAIQTLEPAPSETPTPSPTPAPTSSALATPSGTPIPPPAGATLQSGAGTQKGSVSSFCWSDQEGGQSKCYTHDQQAPASALKVKSGEKVLLRIQAQIAPDQESVRPFQGTRSGYPASQIDPALETDLTVNLPEGKWSMDLCATWHNRGQPICWLFSLNLTRK